MVGNAICHYDGIIMLPKPKHGPTTFGEQLVHALVPFTICRNFGFPPFLIGLRRGPVYRTTVPEATIEKDD